MRLPLDRLQTERLILRRQSVADAAVFHQLWTERDDRVPAHRRLDASGHPTVEDIAAHIRDLDLSRPGLLTVELRETEEPIGYCGVVWGGDEATDEPELAFELLRAVHNRGYATEAALAVLDWARQAGYRRIHAGVWDWNVASRRVLAKLGFRENGIVTKESAYGRSLMTVREL
ncbi:GNAT family N-acetyltransferase [Microbacterium sp. H1-D42]|uniref:GNAT family N-acetyltransferase n=1 Tax=Microbacterium sp. H1-D42 TaxID=2925844 RepID=UPI001F533473|nr:GNAT family N-acetyltransferase [Microbacterium sp. H1-D42]UNK69298.1 GNAT family N-acetyltransferase [Microbacterium sp. H1-D42]